MSFEPKPNNCFLWHVDDKKSDKAPSYRGELTIEGLDGIYEASIWVKTDKNGKKYLSLSIKLDEWKTGKAKADRQESTPAARPAPAKPKGDIDEPDSIPF